MANISVNATSSDEKNLFSPVRQGFSLKIFKDHYQYS